MAPRFRAPVRILHQTILGIVVLMLSTGAVRADSGTGLTAKLEVSYLTMIIDHHFAALRMTEPAAGTDLTRSAQLAPTEGTSPTSGFAATPAKAKLAEMVSLARRDNRVQREEILEAQQFLHDWYGIDHEPQLPPDA